MDFGTILTIVVIIIVIALIIAGYYLVRNIFDIAGGALSDLLGAIGLGNILKTCPPGQFQHQLSGQCYSCKDGYIRSLDPDVNAADACVAQGGCPGMFGKGSFEHWTTGECYSCPEEYVRSLNPDIHAQDGCTYRGGCKGKYGTRAFEHWNTGNCYECPKDMERTLNPDVNSINACEDFRGCAVRFNDPNAFPHMLTGRCYTCTDGYHRTLNPDINAEDGCIATKGCEGLYGPKSFQHILSGSCYACKQGYSRYALEPDITSGHACISDPRDCLGEGGKYVDSLNPSYKSGCYKCTGQGQKPVGQTFDPATMCRYSQEAKWEGKDVFFSCARGQYVFIVDDPNAPNGSGCYSCPPGTHMDAIPASMDRACIPDDPKLVDKRDPGTLIGEQFDFAEWKGKLIKRPTELGLLVSPATEKGSIWYQPDYSGNIWDVAKYEGEATLPERSLGQYSTVY